MSAVENRRGWGFLIVPFWMMLLMWVIFWWDQKMMLDWVRHGLEPGSLSGLQGIIFASFLHGSMEHIGNNSLPVLILTSGLIYYYRNDSWPIILLALSLPWIGVWLFGRPSYHIGASAYIYALASFMFFSGLWKRNRHLLAMALLVVFLYGSLFWGLFPIEERISFEGHLSGAVTGLILSVLFRKKGPAPTIWRWADDEDEEEVEEVPDILVNDWQVIGKSNKDPSATVQVRYVYRPSDDGDKYGA